MSASALALQGVLVALLRDDPAVAGIVAKRVFDSVPAKALFPYVTLGEDRVLPEGGDCLEGVEIRGSIHVWSRAVGFPEAKRLAAAVQDAVEDSDLVVPGYRVVDFGITETRFLRDPDGLTSHGVLLTAASLEPAD